MTMTKVLSFPDRSSGFSPARLVEARLAKQKSRAELAREIDLSGQAIGHYETGERRPDMSVIIRIASALEQPVPFFLKPSPSIERHQGTRYFRSVGARSNKLNYALDVRAKWLWELVNLVGSEIRFPAPNLPDILPPEHGIHYTLEELESAAERVRRHWGLGDGPIANVVALFETHGVIVTRLSLISDDVDAFSCWIEKRPYILLGSEKQSSCRSRFDAAHELAHLLLHRDIAQEDLEEKSVRERIELEAHAFAAAFLFPRVAMMREFFSTRLSHLKGLKLRWRVSMQAIAHWAKRLGIIDDYQYVLFRKQISSNKWNKIEPLDREIPIEMPQWLLKCWRLFAARRALPAQGVEDTIGFSLDLIANLFGAPGETSLLTRSVVATG
ncbi:ImmA/IrrE family metallo-endopeptidase [Methylobacterium sp. WL103]|nr:ImmA/IrrE family metallo-endopeptidase [Methylobacterium sp. WL103]TXN13787.1 ImmA/IrrE family metallo-endopeptidase [Methylobacterium sp. WL122]TXN73005.1 ImmA/IrrE family metallo-endopeptidase [Methylobacterium sp. WL8]